MISSDPRKITSARVLQKCRGRRYLPRRRTYAIAVRRVLKENDAYNGIYGCALLLRSIFRFPEVIPPNAYLYLPSSLRNKDRWAFFLRYFESRADVLIKVKNWSRANMFFSGLNWIFFYMLGTMKNKINFFFVIVVEDMIWL